jgi:hypothetical protein
MRKRSVTALDLAELKFGWREQMQAIFFDGLERLVVAGFYFQGMRMSERLSRRSRQKSHPMRLSNSGVRWALERLRIRRVKSH